MCDGANYKGSMAEPIEMVSLNVLIPLPIKQALEKAQVVDGRPEYSLAHVARVVLARALGANMHLRLEDAGEEASS